MMPGPVYLNGRYLAQPVTGVQRFAAEIVGAIGTLTAAGEWPETTLLTPQLDGSAAVLPGGTQPSARPVGHRQGHLWEQIDLPRAARGGTLVNLGNTAPLLSGAGQVVVIHDAGVFDTPYSYSWKFRLWYKSLQHALVRRGARIATVSEFSRARIAARLGLDPARIAVIYEGADHILRVPADESVLARHGLERGRFALVVGSRAAHKNLAALDEVVQALAARGMVVAMTGGANRAVFQDTEEASAIRSLGRASDAELRALYENAACLLFPSRYEGFGLPPVEAMICGCPVIATRGGAVEEICGEDALYARLDEPASLSGTITRLLDEPGLRADLSARGRARAERLSWASSARLLGDVVRQAA
ncbi:MAG TPA: glycosyltransferase family 1 protein [Acidisoma sp.]|uniref:glycosyltransferase family 4 protein n=1 Tax=Acidisoma sp. TaxID=1872115 RepID=UPI002C176C27|nr:glycosyltransferase family 1 protein [Acidisoma sp.]HTH99763.1 glycosyltransferase family 1 protein [Acidisoma sp.]